MHVESHVAGREIHTDMAVRRSITVAGQDAFNMRGDVETVGWAGHEFGGRRAAVENVGHLLAVTDALLLMRRQHRGIPSLRGKRRGRERGEERRGDESRGRGSDGVRSTENAHAL
jgi:hypothetical protein